MFFKNKIIRKLAFFLNHVQKSVEKEYFDILFKKFRICIEQKKILFDFVRYEKKKNTARPIFLTLNKRFRNNSLHFKYMNSQNFQGIRFKCSFLGIIMLC